MRNKSLSIVAPSKTHHVAYGNAIIGEIEYVAGEYSYHTKAAREYYSSDTLRDIADKLDELNKADGDNGFGELAKGNVHFKDGIS